MNRVEVMVFIISSLNVLDTRFDASIRFIQSRIEDSMTQTPVHAHIPEPELRLLGKPASQIWKTRQMDPTVLFRDQEVHSKLNGCSNAMR